MEKFIAKRHEVTAVRWARGATPPAPLRIVPVTIHFSLAGDAYYVSRGGDRPTAWLGTEVWQGEPTAAEVEATKGVFAPDISAYAGTGPRAGQHWYRQSWSFTVWDFKPGKSRPLDPANPVDAERFADYAAAHRWAADHPEADAFTVGAVGGRLFVKPGQWIVRDGDAHDLRAYAAVDDDAFRAAYDPA